MMKDGEGQDNIPILQNLYLFHECGFVYVWDRIGLYGFIPFFNSKGTGGKFQSPNVSLNRDSYQSSIESSFSLLAALR